MEDQTKQNLLNPDLWIRLIYMVVFAALLCIARLVIYAVAVLQFLLVLLSGSDNRNLRELGQIAAKWSLQVFYFLTFNSEQKPFPFDDWPDLDEKSDDEPDEELNEKEPGALLEEDDSSDEDDTPDKPDNKTE